MVIVDDDVALPDLPQPRGVAGTLFVHKIAGMLADQGASLDAVTEAAERVISGVVSIGMSLDTCTVPGSPKEDRIGPGKAELGLGIHGEAGIEQVDFRNARNVDGDGDRPARSEFRPGPHVALLNNLGGATAVGDGGSDRRARAIADRRQIRWLVGPAPLMTSLDMQGFSVSLLPVTKTEAAARAPLSRPGLGPDVCPSDKWRFCRSRTD